MYFFKEVLADFKNTIGKFEAECSGIIAARVKPRDTWCFDDEW